MMTDQEKRGLLAIALLAAFADGAKSDQERESVRAVAEGIGAEGGISVPAILTEVMLRKLDLAQASKLLDSPESRHLAYEVAVQVCDSDGVRSPEETDFLAQLAKALDLSESECSAMMDAPDAMAAAPPNSGSEPLTTPVADLFPSVVPPSGQGPGVGSHMDAMIRNYAILCGALEMLPQSVAGMAVIPMQIKMVYRIGHAHGQELGTPQIKDLLATLGIGMTSQYLEGFARKLLGGALRRFVGKWGSELGKTSTSVAMSFATTYALGLVANQYYAGGRRMGTDVLRSTYQKALVQAQGLQSQYLPAMQQQAAGLDLKTIMGMIQGNTSAPPGSR